MLTMLHPLALIIIIIIRLIRLSLLLLFNVFHWMLDVLACYFAAMYAHGLISFPTTIQSFSLSLSPFCARARVHVQTDEHFVLYCYMFLLFSTAIDGMLNTSVLRYERKFPVPFFSVSTPDAIVLCERALIESFRMRCENKSGNKVDILGRPINNNHNKIYTPRIYPPSAQSPYI